MSHRSMLVRSVLWGLLSVAGVVAADAVVPSVVTTEALFWLDAASLDAAVGDGLAAWPDARGGDYPGVTTYTTAQPQVIEIAEGALAGKKAVSFTNVPNGTNNQDMRFAETQYPCTVIAVADLDANQKAILLGGPEGENQGVGRRFVFFRGSNGEYRYQNAYTYGSWWENGRPVANTTSTVMPTGYQLFTYSYSEPALVYYMCSDRGFAANIGSKRVCEIVAFARALSLTERAEVEGYLRAKWFGAASTREGAIEMLGKKAQVHFDASAETNFVFAVTNDTTGTLVSQWNDLSGNNNHFKPTHYNANDPKFGALTTVRGRPVYETGACGSRIDLMLTSRLTTTRTVFLVADTQRAYEAYWLGDTSAFRYARGNNGEFAYSNHAGAYLGSKGTVWENGVRVKDVLTDWPDGPGDLSVFTLSTTANCEWCRLCQDRTFSSTTGGKKVAELMTFETNLSDADRAVIEGWLMEKWGPTAAEVDETIAQAAVHVDATSAAQFTRTNDNSIVGWTNQGTGVDLWRPDVVKIDGKGSFTTQAGSYGYTNGVPAFLMGPHGSDIELAFGLMTNIRSVFWVMDIEHAGVTFFLADMKGLSSSSGKTYHFCRGTGSASPLGAYADKVHGADGFKKGSLVCDGVKVAPMTDLPPFGTHVFDFAAPVNLTASSLSMDRGCLDGALHRNGGRALSELLIFTSPVCGLMRRAIRERLAARWTINCGWAGAGDSEWGADKYRVFDSDAEVPAEGAAAAGVGFTEDARLSGGALTMGAGGFFVADGVHAEIATSVSGALVVSGQGGTLAFASAPQLDALTIGYATTVRMPIYGTVAGELVLGEGAQIVFDPTALVKGQPAALTFDSVTVLDGGSPLDHVSLTDSDTPHLLTLSADGKTLLIDDLSEPYTATWTGLGDRANVSDPANWVCHNIWGDVLDETVPNANTAVTVEGETSFNVPAGQTLAYRSLTIGSVTLTADCDWQGLGTVALADSTIDLDGHRLDLVGFSGAGTIGSIVPPAIVRNGTPHSWYDAAGCGEYITLQQDGTFDYWLNKGADGPIGGTKNHNGANIKNSGKRPTYDTTTYGRPTVDFGKLNNGVDLNFPTRRVVRTGFWVVKIEQAMNAFWVGDKEQYGFCRGSNGQYGHTSFCPFAYVWDDGNLVDWAKTLVPDDSFRVVCIQLSQDRYASCFATDRAISGRLGGGRQLSELILFSSVLTETNRVAITSYLQRKWNRIQEAPGELHLHVASGTTLVNSSVRLTGGLKLVKEGAGTYCSATLHDNAGGVEIVAGTVQLGLTGCLPLGSGEVVIDADGTFDRNGYVEECRTHYVLNGGRIVNSGEGNTDGKCQIANLALRTNSTITVTATHGIINANYGKTLVDLAGHELAVAISAGQTFYLDNATLTKGRFVTTSDGCLNINRESTTATETDFDIGSAVELNVSADVHDLTWRFNKSEAYGTSLFRVHGTFLPVTDYFHNVELQDGASLDLLAKSAPWSTTSANTNSGTTVASHYCTFATNATVTVKLDGRTDLRQLARASGPLVIAWEEGQEPCNVTFLPDGDLLERGFRLRVEDAGVRLAHIGGTMILLR